MPEEKRITKEYLKCFLTEAEKRDIADKLALSVMAKDEAEAELKSAQTQIKSKIATQDGIIISCAEKLRSGFEMRYVECEEVKNFEIGHYMLIRQDTGEIIVDRALTAEERQQSFPLS